MQMIPLQAVPSQTLQIVLGGQTCALAIYVKNQAMFLDLAVNGSQIAYAVLCPNQVTLVPTAYLGFVGQLMFLDTQGSNDPIYTGLGSRWLLAYLTQGDMVTYGIS